MTKAEDHAKALATLRRKLRKPPELVEREPVSEFIYTFLIWEGVTARKAELALHRLTAAAVDFNELRTFEPADLAALIGKTYPAAQERAERLRLSLTEIYRREHEVTLAGAIALPKRDGRRYLETLEGMCPFVASRVTLIVLGGHALPLDQPTADILANAGVVEPELSITKQAASLERMVKADEALDLHLRLQAAVESGNTFGRSANAAKRTTKKNRSRPATSPSK